MNTENKTTKTDLYFPTIGEDVGKTCNGPNCKMILMGIAKPARCIGDEHNAVVIVEKPNSQYDRYTVWHYNASDRSFYWGHYFMKENAASAWEAFISKIHNRITG